jgi:hypothetical protein
MQLRRYILALLVFHLAACSSMQTVNFGQSGHYDPPPELEIGKRVEVTTFDREKLEFTVTDVTVEGIGGKFGFIPYENIMRLRVQVPGSGDSNWSGWVLGVITAIGLAWLIASADSVSVCSGTPCSQPQ